MQRSESIGALSAALAKAQGEMAAAAKDSKNPHFNSKYADLASIWNACREPLSKHGLAVIQAPGETAERNVIVTTILSHSSGEWVEETLTIPMTKVDAQGYGSAVTYARRYALAAMVGIAPAEDDGNAAAAIGGDTSAPRKQAAPKPEPEALPKIDFEKWQRDLQIDLDGAPNEAAIDQLKDAHLATMKRARTEAPEAYKAIGEAFAAARADVAQHPVQEKEPA